MMMMKTSPMPGWGWGLPPLTLFFHDRFANDLLFIPPCLSLSRTTPSSKPTTPQWPLHPPLRPGLCRLLDYPWNISCTCAYVYTCVCTFRAQAFRVAFPFLHHELLIGRYQFCEQLFCTKSATSNTASSGKTWCKICLSKHFITHIQSDTHPHTHTYTQHIRWTEA